MNLSPRVLKEGQRQAALTAQRVKTAFQQMRIRSWTDIEKTFAIQVPQVFKDKPFTYVNVAGAPSSFCEFWKLSFQARLEAAIETKAEEKPVIKVDKNVSTYGGRTLMPEQEGVVNSMYDALQKDNAILQDGYTGSGKMVMGAALIAKLIANGILKDKAVMWRPCPFIIFCPKAVEIAWKRELALQGLEEYQRKGKVLVFPTSSFSAEHTNMFVTEKEDLYTEQVTVEWQPMLVPYLAIVDESHQFVNDKTWRTKALLALIQSKTPKKMVFMSATPFEKVNDSKAFCISLDTQLLGVHVNEDTFKQFAQMLDSRPDKPNREALKRLRSVVSPYIHSIPYVKPPHTAVNHVWLVDFWLDKHREIYETAHDRYIQACERAGKNTNWGQLEKLVALNNFRRVAEPLRAPHIAERCAMNYHSGTLATAVGAAYKETITSIAFELVDKYKIPRERISVIWGGKKEYKPQELLSKEEIKALLSDAMNARDILSDSALRKKVINTLNYTQDMYEHQETVEEQAHRHKRLKELRLVGNQVVAARQWEIDNFKSGATQICLFTIATGGIGLSFDRNKKELLRREGVFTPVYSGKEFQQLLGRLVRRASVDGADQYITMLAGTVEETHVAPVLDNKLKCIAEVTNRSFDIVELLNHKVERRERPKLRTDDEVLRDALNDNTVVTDFVAVTDEDDEEEESELANA